MIQSSKNKKLKFILNAVQLNDKMFEKTRIQKKKKKQKKISGRTLHARAKCLSCRYIVYIRILYKYMDGLK